MMEFYSSYMRTARKVHICEYCGKEIAIDERYSYESGKFDGDFFERKLCIPCSKMLDEYSRKHRYNDFFDWWCVDDYLVENYCDSICNSSASHIRRSCMKAPQRCEKIREKFIKAGEQE